MLYLYCVSNDDNSDWWIIHELGWSVKHFHYLSGKSVKSYMLYSWKKKEQAGERKDQET